jgi:hypothetical protein
MPNPVARAARWRAHAAASLASAEATLDEKTRDVHLAIAKHFLSLAEDAIKEAKGGEDRWEKLPNGSSQTPGVSGMNIAASLPD